MKVYCLSSDPSKPCFVVSFHGLLVMLDCGLSLQSAMHFLPAPPVPLARLQALPAWRGPGGAPEPALAAELRECCGRVFVDSEPEFVPPLDKVVDFSQLDAILLSNYTCMQALPYVTEETGFRGTVYCTEPTLTLGRLQLEELCGWLGGGGGGGGGGRRARRWTERLHVLPPPLAHAQRPRAWRRLYSRDALERSLRRVRVVGYDERVSLCGLVEATPVSSGYCLGSANWVLQARGDKLCYVSGSSTLTTHPRPMAVAPLRGARALLLAALTAAPAHNPDNTLGDLCVHVAGAVRGGGGALLPVAPAGVLYDLLECLSAHLEAAGLGHVPLFLLSEAGEPSLAYSNILAEWVAAPKQARVYLPEEPFPHGALLRAGRLRRARRLHDDAFSTEFRQPCVVFCGSPSLRCGPAVHLMELWRGSAQHAVVLTDPAHAPPDALAPYQPLAMRAFHCPIDTALSHAQCAKLLRELRPRALLLPEPYAPGAPGTPGAVAAGPGAGAAGAGAGAAGAGAGAAVKSWVPADIRTIVVRRGAGAGVALARGAVRGELLAACAPGPVSLALELRDHRVRLRAAPGPGGGGGGGGWGWWAAPHGGRLAAALGAARGAVLHAAAHDALLHLEPHCTHVFCAPEARAALVRALRRAAPAPPPALRRLLPAAADDTDDDD